MSVEVEEAVVNGQPSEEKDTTEDSPSYKYIAPLGDSLKTHMQ